LSDKALDSPVTASDSPVTAPESDGKIRLTYANAQFGPSTPPQRCFFGLSTTDESPSCNNACCVYTSSAPLCVLITLYRLDAVPGAYASAILPTDVPRTFTNPTAK